eukprot:COSAG01_NODE_4162_length_5279_cov_33.245560_2_plen_325_part_00
MLKRESGCNASTFEGCLTSLSNPAAYIRDTTHPSTRCILENKVQHSIDLGFTLIKYDFLNLAAYEGRRFDMTLAPTGLAAYSYGLRIIAEAVAGRAVVDYSISLPLPVGPAGHARRVGCDQMFGGVEYSMNQFAGGGFWLNNLYTWLDPDLITFEGDFWFAPNPISAFASMDAKARVAKAVVFGGLYLNGDDLTNSTVREVVVQYLGNSAVNEMWQRSARSGDPSSSNGGFRPASAWGGGLAGGRELAPSIFVNAARGDLAVFNYLNVSRSFELDLRYLLGKDDPIARSNVTCVDVWGALTVVVWSSVTTIRVEGLSAALLHCD